MFNNNDNKKKLFQLVLSSIILIYEIWNKTDYKAFISFAV
jgi:hypothetical protein